MPEADPYRGLISHNRDCTAPKRRKVAAEVERGKQTNDPRHPMYNHPKQRVRLKSRKSFIDLTEETDKPEQRRLDLWKETLQHPKLDLKEEGSPGFDLPYTTWKSLNRLRTAVTRCKSNLVRWGYAESDSCECGAVQDFDHLLSCPNLPTTCTRDDFFMISDRAIKVADYWKAVV